MPTVRVYLGISLDGCIAGPDDSLDFLHQPELQPAPDAPPTGALDFPGLLARTGAMLMGRRTHDVVAGMGAWPYGELPVLVATSRPLSPAAPTVRAVSGPIAELIAQAREVAGERDVYVDGGALTRSALQADLIDELCLTVLPTLLGPGIRLFDGLTTRSDWTFSGVHRYGGMAQLTLVRRGSGHERA